MKARRHSEKNCSSPLRIPGNYSEPLQTNGQKRLGASTKPKALTLEFCSMGLCCRIKQVLAFRLAGLFDVLFLCFQRSWQVIFSCSAPFKFDATAEFRKWKPAEYWKILLKKGTGNLQRTGKNSAREMYGVCYNKAGEAHHFSKCCSEICMQHSYVTVLYFLSPCTPKMLFCSQ